MSRDGASAGRDALTDRPAAGLVLGVAAIVVAVVIGAWIWGRKSPQVRILRPELSISTPHLNARPGVTYVGDAACVVCHDEIARSYKHHPMGQSLAEIADAPPELRGEDTPRTLFEVAGSSYGIERRDGVTYHHEIRRDGQGREVARVQDPVRFVLGSGSLARAFLIERDGYLHQSPITWYTQEARWDLAPGYDHPMFRDARFERPVMPDCLICHANRFDHVKGTESRYREPIFMGLSIGCERCHGPGELHVQDPIRTPGSNPNIVNPSELEPALRENVCEQCHLLGEASVIRPGRSIDEYRPGLPLDRFLTYFVRPGMARNNPNAGHVEQMHQSRCFQGSNGAMGCISCHDPHSRPPAEEKVAFYRSRCLSCHADQGCRFPEEVRLQRDPKDDCVACHMPRTAASNVPHLTTTLHRIPRLVDPLAEQAAPASRHVEVNPAELVPFHPSAPDDADSETDLRRARAIVLAGKGPDASKAAVPDLEAAIARDPGDIPARESLAAALSALGREDEALDAYRDALEVAPESESTLRAAALLASRLERTSESIDLWRRAIAVDPVRAAYHSGLANDLAHEGQWEDALDSAREALRLNAFDDQARMVLATAYARLGSTTRADEEFERLPTLFPERRFTPRLRGGALAPE